MLPNERTTRSEVVTLPGEVEGLVAASDRTMARPLVEFLKGEGINVTLVLDADSAFEEALLHRPNVVLVDDRIPPAGGIDLCERLKGNTRTHFVPTLLFSQSDVRQHRLRALAAGADAIFSPSTDAQERQTRLWALLRTQAIYRRQEKKQRSQGSAIQKRSRWIGGFVHDLQSSIGALQVNFDYLVQAAQGKLRGDKGDLDECVTDTQTLFRQLVRGLRTVVDYDRFETGRVALKALPVLLSHVVHEVQAELQWQARATGKELEVFPPAHEQAVIGDADHLKEAILSLVGFTLRQPGNRKAMVRQWSAGGITRISVRGDAERISTEDKEKIFEPYAQVSKQAPVGHGLGLALAKVVFELHEGSLTVEDVADGGTEFVAELRSDSAAATLRTVE